MVFTIQSQYIDSVGKLRIIYGFYKKQLINLLTFPLPPLAKVVNNPYNKVKSFPDNKIKIDDFVEHLKNELNCDEVIHTSAGYWFKNSTFPPSVFVPAMDTPLKPDDLLPFPLMVDRGSPRLSKLDTYKNAIHKANIFKQYVLFLYACDTDNYSLENSFVIKGPNHNYDFENWNPPNWLSLENDKMFVLNSSFKLPRLSLSELPPRLSELTSTMFRKLNFERLKMCFKDGRGECKTEYLPKPTVPGKWKEYPRGC